MNKELYPIFLFCFGILCCSALNCDNKRNTEQIIASPTVTPIIGLDSSALGLPYIREFVEYYFSSRCGVRPTFSDVPAALGKPGPKIFLCTKETARLHGIKLSDGEIQNDGFHLITTLDKQAAPVIYCVGNTVNGIKYAIYRLIHELSYDQSTLSLTHPVALSVTPFFENRLSLPALSWTLGDNEADTKYFFSNWSETKVVAMAHLFDFFGFNGVETNFGCMPGHDVTNDTTQKRVVKLCDEERRIGGKAVAFIWGAAFQENEKINEVCFNTREDREKMLQSYKNQAKVMGSHVDAFVSHWADPGGKYTCDCTIRIPQLYHLELMKSMQEYNPEIESFFSLWGLKGPTIQNERTDRNSWNWHWITKGIDDVLDANLLPASVGIWVGDPFGFNPDYCRAIINKGRTLGIWTWYLADNEIRQGLHIHWKQVSEYFRDLSAEDYAKDIKWHQLESNQQGNWNSINMAVGGAMMIDPRGDAEQYAREFCSSIVGENNADILLEILDAIARSRCLYSRNLVGGNAFHDLEGWGSGDPGEDINRIQKALESLDKVTLEKNFVPKIPYMELIYDPEVMLSDLRKSLQNILLHNKARTKLLAAIASGAFQSLTGADKQERIKKLSKELAPVFDFKGIGTCPEAQVWNRLKQTGLIPEVPLVLKKKGIIPELSH
ncbi:MAG: hypothetical protein M0Q53_00705 [Prolixibacteraceae bacterium]|jgi:hypothetical protein|nr:hypothetical protein [Prolixibacteraceae bacterium]